MTTPSLQDEVAFISSINADKTLAQFSYYGWDNNNPATYSSGWTTARKWGGTTAGSAGGTVTYRFDPGSNWSPTEQGWFSAGLALWSAVANISFVPTTNSRAGITFTRTNDSGSYTYAVYSPTYNADVTGGTVLGAISYASVNIDTTGTSFGPINGLASQGGFTVENLLHEEGHALGLGHAGPYNGGAGNGQQYSPYDNLRWSIMSYFDPGNTGAKYYSQTPVKGGIGGAPTTIMPLDILAIQRLYGVAVNTPLSGGQVFGFHTNITGAIKPFFDFTQNTKPVITLWDKGLNNTLDLSGFTGTARVNLNPGTFSSTNGMNNNIGIAFGTQINKIVCTSGGTSVTCNNFGDTVFGGAGNDTIYVGSGADTIYGGGGSDTVVYSGAYANYNIVHNSNGTITVSGGGANDTLSNIEVLKFSDKTVSPAGATIVADGVQPAAADVIAGTDTSTLSGQVGWDSTFEAGTMAGLASGGSFNTSDVLSQATPPGIGYADAPTRFLSSLPLSAAHSSWHVATM